MPCGGNAALLSPDLETLGEVVDQVVSHDDELLYGRFDGGPVLFRHYDAEPEFRGRLSKRISFAAPGCRLRVFDNDEGFEEALYKRAQRFVGNLPDACGVRRRPSAHRATELLIYQQPLHEPLVLLQAQKALAQKPLYVALQLKALITCHGA